MPEMFSAGQGGVTDHDHSAAGQGGELSGTATLVSTIAIRTDMKREAQSQMIGRVGSSQEGLALLMAFGG